MGKVTSLGRVAGSRWYTGNDFNEVKKPLDGDMYFHSENSFVYQYSLQTKEWVKILEFEPKIVEEYVNKQMNLYLKKSGGELTGNLKLKTFVSSIINSDGRNILTNDLNIILGNNVDKTEIRKLDKIYALSQENGTTYTTGKKDQVLTSNGQNLYWKDNDFINSEELQNKLKDYVTTNTQQDINAKKTFNKPIELIGDDVDGRIQPTINDKALVGAPNKHFKQSYVNETHSNLVLPITRNGVSPVTSTGSIGSNLYHWLNAYIKNVYASVLYENGKPISQIYLTEDDLDEIKVKIEKLLVSDSDLIAKLKDYYTKTQTDNLLADKANHSYVDMKVAELIAEELDSNPDMLNTLKELSQALGNDENFATTVTNLISSVESKLNIHVADKNNPHQVNWEQVIGLKEKLEEGNATQELLEKHMKNLVDSNGNELPEGQQKNPHNVTIDDIPGLKDALDKGSSDNENTDDNLNKHIIDYNNPHKVTKEQVGLSNVDNTSDKDKPISDAVQEALDQLDGKFDDIKLDDYYTKEESNAKFVPFNYYTAGEGIAISDTGVISLSVEFAEEGSY